MFRAPPFRELLHARFEALVDVVPPLTFGWLSLWYLLTAAGQLHAILSGAPFTPMLGALLSTVSIAAYTILLTWLMIVRYRPIAKARGWRPRFAAMAGTFLPLALVLLPAHRHLPLVIDLVSCSLAIAGTLCAVTILRHLDRSFSIMPEARRLVTGGAYAYLRHPLYLTEAVVTLAALIQFWSLVAVLIVALQFSCQFWRMDCEERVLRQAFPEYEGYSRKTSRLIPGLY